MQGLPHNFHEGCIDALEVGPRHELRLTLTGFFPVSDTEAPSHRIQTWYLRFGGIENIEAVRVFCTPRLLRCRLGFLDYAEDEPSRAHRLVFNLNIYDDDTTLRIRCRIITISQTAPEVSL